MPDYPAANYLTDSARSEAEFKTNLEAWLARTKQLPGGAIVQDLTISSGTVTPSSSSITLNCQSGTTDDLDTISKSSFSASNTGYFLTVSGKDGEVIWLNDNVGSSANKLELSGDSRAVALTCAQDSVTFIQSAAGWREVARSLRPQIARIKLSATQTGSSAPTYTTLNFGVIVEDTLNLFGGTAANAITVSSSKVRRVRLTQNILFDSAATGSGTGVATKITGHNNGIIHRSGTSIRGTSQAECRASIDSTTTYILGTASVNYAFQAHFTSSPNVAVANADSFLEIEVLE